MDKCSIHNLFEVINFSTSLLTINFGLHVYTCNIIDTTNFVKDKKNISITIITCIILFRACGIVFVN